MYLSLVTQAAQTTIAPSVADSYIIDVNLPVPLEGAIY